MAILLFNDNKGENQKESTPFRTVDHLLASLYQSISAEKGAMPNWILFRKLFRSEARINALGKDKYGKERYISLTVEDYIRGTEATFQKQGFREVEIGRITEEFGDMVHAFSSYETLDTAHERVLQRGINSIQMIYRDDRFWIISLLFHPETENQQISGRHVFPKEEEVISKTKKAVHQK
jgi:hypothetical protein